MKALNSLFALLFCAVISLSSKQSTPMITTNEFKPYSPPVSYEEADKKAEEILATLSIDDKIELIGGHNYFFVKGVKAFNIPRLYLSDATQGVHLRKDLDGQLEKSTAFPCPIALTATWNTELAAAYAKSIGEECRAGDIAVLLGPGMNIYRIAQNGRNFEYFGEDPFLAARFIENYVVGVQNTGTIATLKHFVANNTDYRRRTSNSVVGERALHEIYLPAFKAGVDAGAMAVMTAYNQVNGEWAGQSDEVINGLLRGDLGYKWLVMSDWWSIWDPEKAIKSGQDLDMPGHGIPNDPKFEKLGDPFLRSNAKQLLEAGKVSEGDIHRMAKNVLRVSIAMGIDKRPVKDTTYLNKFPEHLTVALQTARESLVLLKNKNALLPLNKTNVKQLILLGDFVEEIPMGGGSAAVEGYNQVNMLTALQNEFGPSLTYLTAFDKDKVSKADAVILSIGTLDSEGWDTPFDLPAKTLDLINKVAASNRNVVVVVNTGHGINMSSWADKVPSIVYGWYPGQNGYEALAEVIVGKTNPSGKLPFTIEKAFSDSPGYPYIPEGEELYEGWDPDLNMELPIYDINYDEGVFVGYRWYEHKKIEPMFAFGHGLSYTTFEYSALKLSAKTILKDGTVVVSVTVKNTGKSAGAEIIQIYVSDTESTVIRPEKELKGFKKVFLESGESKTISVQLHTNAFAFYNVENGEWTVEPGKFVISAATASDIILQTESLEIIE